MNKKKNNTAKIVAMIALLAIIIGIIGTGALAIFSGFSHNNSNSPEITEQELQQYLDTLSGSTTIEADGVTIQTGEELLNQENIEPEETVVVAQEDNSNQEEVILPEDVSPSIIEGDQAQDTSGNRELEASIETETNLDITEEDADVIETLVSPVSE